MRVCMHTCVRACVHACMCVCVRGVGEGLCTRVLCTCHFVFQLFFSAVVQLPDGVSVQHVSCGHSHCIALDSHGQLFSWGDNTHGQLGVGRSESSKPV